MDGNSNVPWRCSVHHNWFILLPTSCQSRNMHQFFGRCSKLPPETKANNHRDLFIQKHEIYIELPAEKQQTGAVWLWLDYYIRKIISAISCKLKLTLLQQQNGVVSGFIKNTMGGGGCVLMIAFVVVNDIVTCVDESYLLKCYYYWTYHVSKSHLIQHCTSLGPWQHILMNWMVMYVQHTNRQGFLDLLLI